MERTIEQLQRNKEKTEMRIRTDSKLRTKQNTRLVDWVNRLKFENTKQYTILERKKLDLIRDQERLQEMKRKEAKVRRQYNEMLERTGNPSRASSAVRRSIEHEGELHHTASEKTRGRMSSATRLS